MEITNLQSFFLQFTKDVNIQESHNQGFVVGVEHIPSTTCQAGCRWCKQYVL